MRSVLFFLFLLPFVFFAFVFACRLELYLFPWLQVPWSWLYLLNKCGLAIAYYNKMYWLLAIPAGILTIFLTVIYHFWRKQNG